MSKLVLQRAKKSLLFILIRLSLGIILLSNFAFAELQELEDDKLDELRGKEGITIDLAFKLSIGEIAFDFNDREFEDGTRQKKLAPPPPRIEYHQNGN